MWSSSEISVLICKLANNVIMSLLQPKADEYLLRRHCITPFLNEANVSRVISPVQTIAVQTTVA